VGKFIVKRTLQMIPVLIVVSVLIFAMVRITPSDPVASMTKGKNVSEETRQELRVRYHLDKNPAEQYLIWITGTLHGDLGESYQYKQSVGSLISQRIGITLSLVILSGILSVLVAIPVGVISAVKMNSALDKFLSVLTLVFVASPVFLTAIIMMFVFALKMGLFPSFGTGNGLWDSLYHMVLPSVALAMNMVALTSRITRTSMIEQLNSDYIRTATAKGIPRMRVIVTYALKNALIPIITVTSIQIGSMLVGAVLVESVFAMGGLGDLLISGIKAADYPVVQGVTLLLVFIFLCINLVVDIFYAILDPRIRLK
jgi:peptide/nickel transport system permease protein